MAPRRRTRVIRPTSLISALRAARAPGVRSVAICVSRWVKPTTRLATGRRVRSYSSRRLSAARPFSTAASRWPRETASWIPVVIPWPAARLWQRAASGEQDTPRAVVIGHAVLQPEPGAPDDSVHGGRARHRTSSVQEALHVGDVRVLRGIVPRGHHPAPPTRPP